MRRILCLIGIVATLAACTTAAKSAAVEAPVAAETGLAADTTAAVKTFADANRFSGIVFVAKDGKEAYVKGFGLANREFNIPVKPDTEFRLGSITKQFTAASILQLAEQGKLSLDDPLSKYYANSPAAWSGVTIRHLLSHRSGIADYTELPDFFEKLAMTERTPEQILDLTRDKPVLFAPGAKFAYDNSGYIALGLIIEKASGQTYEAYVDAHIFKPLGMAHSGYDMPGKIIPNRASGYNVSKDSWTNATYIAMSLPYAAGSLYSTAADLLTWEEALFGGKVISAASLQAMTTDHGEKYGYGLVIDAFEGHRNIWHNGGINGFATHMNRFVDDGLTVIVLSNLESAAAGRVATDVSRIWLGLPPPPKLVEVTVPPEVLDRYVGVYELMPNFNVTITRNGAWLMAQATGQAAFALTATSNTEFHYEAAGVRIVFPAGEGAAQEFTLYQGQPLVAKRIAAPPAN